LQRAKSSDMWMADLMADVRYWHLADIDAGAGMSASGAKADIPDPHLYVR